MFDGLFGLPLLLLLVLLGLLAEIGVGIILKSPFVLPSIGSLIKHILIKKLQNGFSFNALNDQHRKSFNAMCVEYFLQYILYLLRT